MLLELHQVLSRELAAEIATALEAAPFSDGKTSAHGAARDAKNNLQLDPADPLAQRLGGRVLTALAQHDTFKAAAIPRTILPLIFARYTGGMQYGRHLDLPLMCTPSGPLRTDLSLTVWLSPKDSYGGGELIIDGDGGERCVKCEAGDAVLYSSSSLHRVAPVTSGERVVAISWIQSLVRDPEHRSILYGLSESATTLEREGPAAEAARLRQLQHRLLRLWAEC